MIDSGGGFDFKRKASDGVSENLFGRGLSLIQELAESIHIHEPGNNIEVNYRWNNED